MVKGTTTTKNNWKLSRRERKYTLQYMKCLTILCMYKLFCCFIFFFLMGWEISFSHSLAWASTAFVSTWHCFFFFCSVCWYTRKLYVCVCMRLCACLCEKEAERYSEWKGESENKTCRSWWQVQEHFHFGFELCFSCRDDVINSIEQVALTT